MSSSEIASMTPDGTMAHLRPARSLSADAGSVPSRATSAMPLKTRPAHRRRASCSSSGRACKH